MLESSLLILDFFNPELLLEQKNAVGKEVTIFTSDNLNVVYECIEVDNGNHIISSKITIKEIFLGVCKEYIDYQKLRYYTLEQISKLLSDTGFEIVDIYSGYNQFHSKDEIIISACIARGVQ